MLRAYLAAKSTAARRNKRMLRWRAEAMGGVFETSLSLLQEALSRLAAIARSDTFSASHAHRNTTNREPASSYIQTAQNKSGNASGITNSSEAREQLTQAVSQRIDDE